MYHYLGINMLFVLQYMTELLKEKLHFQYRKNNENIYHTGCDVTHLICKGTAEYTMIQ